MARDSLTTRRKTLAVLRILNEHGKPMGATRLARELGRQGIMQSERMVRLYLEQLDEAKLTVNLGRRGRNITPRGLEELASALVVDKVGFVAARADALAYRMTFDADRQTGTLVVNVSMVPMSQLDTFLRELECAFRERLGIGDLVGFAKAGETLAGQAVPAGHIGVATVCSLTINGIFLKAGIPMTTVFGGLLEMERGKPRRLVEIIRYDGTTIDPLEIFIQGGMTSVSQVAYEGAGRIGVGYREVPDAARPQLLEWNDRLEALGLGGILMIGTPNHALLDVPVTYGRTGLILRAGLNPIAAAHERGGRTRNIAMCALLEREHLYHYSYLRQWARVRLA